MFCPKCGIENAETNKYCRACRENLIIVSQAMKQRLPVVLASRLDQMLDSRSERFRRDSILWLLMGLVHLLAILSGTYGKPDVIRVFLFPLLFLSGACWEYFAYRRSLAPDFDWEAASEETINAERFDKSGIVKLCIDSAHAEDRAQTRGKKNSQLF